MLSASAAGVKSELAPSRGFFLRVSRSLGVLLPLGLACVAYSATAAGAPASMNVPAEHAAGEVDLPVRRERLENGLRVVLSVDHSSPNVAVCVTYDVGSRNEGHGQSGFAHLFEHMMFEGSRNVPKGEHFRMLASRGGSADASTTSEHTAYFDAVPSSELDLALWLEADRMKTLALSDRKLENQRAVVQEEYRTHISNSAYAFGALRLRQLAFQGYPPYEHAAIGSIEDLETAELEWVQSFHRDYYAPNNAVLSVVGDFDPDRVMELVHQHFGDAARARIPTFEPPAVPRQTSERLSVIEDTNAKTPGVYFGWVIPPARTSEHYALEVLASVLGSGESSSLHQLLVRDKSVAREASAYTHRHRGPGLFVTRLLLTERSSIDDVQKLVEGEFRRLRTVGPTDGELSRAKARIRSRFVRALESNRDRATTLASYEVLWGDAGLVNGELAAFNAVTKADVQRVMATHLTDGRRSIVEIYPPGWIKDEYPAVLTRTHIVRKGDSLIKIASQYGVSVADLVKKNRLKRNQPIFPGQKFIIPRGGKPSKAAPGKGSKPGAARKPAGRVHVVKKGETLGGIAKKYGVSIASITANNKVGANKRIVIGQKLLIVPDDK